MSTLSIEAANAAMRLDPGLLPPVGSCVRWRRNSLRRNESPAWYEKFRRGGGTVTGVSTLNRGVRVCVRPASEIMLHTAHGDVCEIVGLPDNCPPLSEWVSVSELSEGEK